MKFLKKSIMKLLMLLIPVLLFSCQYEIKSNYSLYNFDYVPDSLKHKQAEFVVNTVKSASSSHLGGDYEDVDDTIEEANDAARSIFKVSGFGLRKERNGAVIFISPTELTERERLIVDSLRNL